MGAIMGMQIMGINLGGICAILFESSGLFMPLWLGAALLCGACLALKRMKRDADEANAETSAAEEEEMSVALLSALTVACAAARRPAPHYSARLAAFVMMDGFFRPITGYHLARAAGSAVR